MLWYPYAITYEKLMSSQRQYENEAENQNKSQIYPPYIPGEVINEGFVGDLDVYTNARTVIIVYPSASLEDTERSLEIILQDIRLRIGKREVEVKN